MNDTDEGFVLMEVILSIAIILTLGSILVVASNTSMKGSLQINETIKTAQTIAKIDRTIRESVDNLYIPYFSNPDPYIDTLTSGLFRSNIGSHLKNINIVYDKKRNKGGIEAVYTVNRIELKTVAIFPSVKIAEME